MTHYYDYPSPIGTLRIESSDDKINSISFVENLQYKTSPLCTALQMTISQLDSYFSGEKYPFHLPIEFKTGTIFEQKVWKALQDIPYGQTRSYKQIAQAIGKPTTSRAVGNANNKNPLAIVIPCHRVIGSNGSLVGYAGGLDKKSFLLELEKTSK